MAETTAALPAEAVATATVAPPSEPPVTESNPEQAPTPYEVVQTEWNSLDDEMQEAACIAWRGSEEAFRIINAGKVTLPDGVERSTITEFYTAECGEPGPPLDAPGQFSGDYGWAILEVFWRDASSDTADEMCQGWIQDREGSLRGFVDDEFTEEVVGTFFDDRCGYDPNVLQPGTYLVPEEVQPGQYRTVDNVTGGSCYMSQDLGSDIVDNLREEAGRPVFTVEEVAGSTFSIDLDCGPVTRLDRG